jgi:hypothetical protein
LLAGKYLNPLLHPHGAFVDAPQLVQLNVPWSTGAFGLFRFGGLVLVRMLSSFG